VRANTDKIRYQLLDSIERVATQMARASGIPEDLLPFVYVYDDGAPTTTNDAALTNRVRKAMVAGMGEDAFIDWYKSEMGTEDFSELMLVDPPIPSVYFEVGGTPPEFIESGEWASHYLPLFKIDSESSM
jgi:metal-dependent amidase/aminoacylase/carboxypeptidase family protein